MAKDTKSEENQSRLGSGASPAGVGWPPKPNVNVEASGAGAGVGDDGDDDKPPIVPLDPKQVAAAKAAETGSAFIVENEGRIICRPPPGVALHTLGQVVLGNVVAHVDGKSVTIKHGTPIRGLPSKIIDKLRATRGISVGRIPSPAEKQVIANGG